MGKYTDHDKDTDAAMLESLEGAVRTDTKRMLARVANDKQVSVELLRRMALKAGATLDCFVKMHRKKHRAMVLADKHLVVKQLLRPKGAVRLAGAERMATEAEVTSQTNTTQPTRKRKRKDLGGTNPLVGMTVSVVVAQVAKMSPVPLPDGVENILSQGTLMFVVAMMAKWKGKGKEEDAEGTEMGETNNDMEYESQTIEERTIHQFVQQHPKKSFEAFIEEYESQTGNVSNREKKKLQGYFQKIKRHQKVVDYSKHLLKEQHTINEKHNANEKKQQAEEKQNEKISQWTKRLKRFLPMISDVSSKKMATTLSKDSTQRTLRYTFYTLLVAAAGAALYYIAPMFDEDEEEWDPETDEEVRRSHEYPLARLVQRGKDMQSKLRTYFRTHPMFTLGFTTAALFTAYAFRKRTRNKEIAKILLGFAEAPTDTIHLKYSDESYADTKECLKQVDPKLHEVFLRYDGRETSDALPKVYYHVVRAQHKRQQATLISDRAVLNSHLIRTDGSFRDSLGEVARAVTYHWRSSNLASIGWTRVKRIFTFRRKPNATTRRSSSSSTRDSGTRKKGGRTLSRKVTRA